jgi:hypothetical protein
MPDQKNGHVAGHKKERQEIDSKTEKTIVKKSK